MDINLLSRMVGELLIDNDRVNLPGIGTLVAIQMPASFSDRGYTINPPYRKLSVIPDEEEDNLIVDLYASSNGINRDEATLILSNFLKTILYELEEFRFVSLPRLGRLRKTQDGSLFFVEDEDINIDSIGYKLDPVSLKTHPVLPDFGSISQDTAARKTPEVPAAARKIPEVPAAAQPEAPVVSDTPSGKRCMNKWMVLLIAALVLVAVFLLTVAVLGRVAPAFVDKLLYSADELRILYY